jgi:hypothetical protein
MLQLSYNQYDMSYNELRFASECISNYSAHKNWTRFAQINGTLKG